MCEIAVLPAQHNAEDNADHIETMVEVGQELFRTNQDGIGVVAVIRNEESGTFEYKVWKSAEEEPNWGGLKLFYEMFMEESWRFILHARLATAGGTGIPQTHPISTKDCPETDINYVVHNGVVRGARHSRKKLKESGHEFTTTVDTEVISHKWGNVPSELTDDVEEPRMSGRLNYLLLGDEKILVRNTGKYNIGDDMQMTCARRGWSDFAGDDEGMHLFSPDGSYEYAEINKEPISTGSSGNAASGNWWRRRGSFGDSSNEQQEAEEETENNRTFAYYGAENEYGEACKLDEQDQEEDDGVEMTDEEVWQEIKASRRSGEEPDWESVGHW